MGASAATRAERTVNGSMRKNIILETYCSALSGGTTRFSVTALFGVANTDRTFLTIRDFPNRAGVSPAALKPDQRTAAVLGRDRHVNPFRHLVIPPQEANDFVGGPRTEILPLRQRLFGKRDFVADAWVSVKRLVRVHQERLVIRQRLLNVLSREFCCELSRGSQSAVKRGAFQRGNPSA